MLGYSFIQVVCLTTGPKPPPKRALHIVRSRAFSFKCEYSLLSLRSSSSILRLLPCLPVTSIPPFTFPSIARCRRQFLRKMWPIQFAFRLRISCRIFHWSLTLSNTSSFGTLYKIQKWRLIDMTKYTLRAFENRVLRKIFGHRTDEATGEWRKLHNGELYDLYCSPNSIRVIKPRRMRWAGHVARMGEGRCIKGFGGETWGKEITWKT